MADIPSVLAVDTQSPTLEHKIMNNPKLGLVRPLGSWNYIKVPCPNVVIFKARFGLHPGDFCFLANCRWLLGYPHAVIEVSSIESIQASQSSIVY